MIGSRLRPRTLIDALGMSTEQYTFWTLDDRVRLPDTPAAEYFPPEREGLVT